MQRSSVSLVLGSVLSLAPACGGKSGGGDAGAGDGGFVECLTGLQSLALSPADSTVTLDGGAAPPVSFAATGTFDDGSVRELDPDRLAWEATRNDDTPPGEIAGGVLEPYPLAGGVVTVTATDGCQSGSTTVTFVLEVTLGQPSDPSAWSGTPTPDGDGPVIVYPSDQTRFPRNIYRTLFQWRTGAGAEFRLRFDGPGSTVTVYTDGNGDPECDEKDGCWRADEIAWSFIAGSNAGSTVTLTLDALDTSTTPPTVLRAETIEIGFSRRDVRGAVFYWSTTSKGIRRANIADEFPEDYIVGGTTYEDGDEVKCVACHAVSRDGQYMAAPVDSAQTKSLWIKEVSIDAPPPPLVKEIDNTGGHMFASISPDNQFVAVTHKGGDLWIADRVTGNFIEDVPVAGEATHPDWAPDGQHLVYATRGGDAPGGAAIARISFAGPGNWGSEEILVQRDPDQTDLWPMYSPDGAHIAFSRGKGGHGDNRALLYLVGAGGGEPTELVNANRIVSNRITDGQHQNSLPTWAPSGDLYWVAFNSKREYGVVLGGGRQQIWVAAIDPDKIGTGEDPSYPAFRLQFQGLNENNHRAYWTLDIRVDPPPPTTDPPECVPSGEECNPGLDHCCEPNEICTTTDQETYICRFPPID